MADDDQLKPNDFPVHSEKNKIVKSDGSEVAETKTPQVAEDMANRLNSEELKEDRWA